MRNHLGAPSARRRFAPSLRRPLGLVFLALILAGCTANEAFRTAAPAECERENCDTAFIEKHGAFDLAFVEFTERGNVFSRERMREVLDHVRGYAEGDGVTAIVFAHGWKHNAAHTDGNVVSFRKLLGKTAALTAGDGRRVVGVYIGWRGLSLDLGFLTNVSYWERKAVAHQVGKGGVTELILRLEKAVIDEKRPNKNLFLVTGHSFGGAIVLTALSEILLERVVAAKVSDIQSESESRAGGEVCVVGRAFGHGVVLLNPAIEANEALQLKELVSEKCFVARQDRFMHVISSDADKATNQSFRIGQWLGVNLTWQQARLTREFGANDQKKTVEIDESDLDTITVGNFLPFRTGLLQESTAPGTQWKYSSCVEREDCVRTDLDKRRHIPVRAHEPLAFIRTDSAFIADHNDVFNDNVAAYLAAIVAEAMYKRVPEDGEIRPEDLFLADCNQNGRFDFGPCFHAYQPLFRAIDVGPK